MRLAFYCTMWGFADHPVARFCERAADAGFDGIEVTIEPDPRVARQVANEIRAAGLGFVALRWSEPLADPTAELHEYERHLRVLAEVEPEFVNCHSGRDWYDRAENQRFLDTAAAVSAETGIPIRHETHRGRFSFCAASTCEFLRANPDLALTADFSHWCAVSESLLEDQDHLVAEAIERVEHVHCRVGYSQGPQVGDPRAPEWRGALEAHLGWWRRIAESHRRRGSPRLTLTPEFGPWPYMVERPFTREPLADQWDVNCFMMEHVRTHLADPAEE